MPNSKAYYLAAGELERLAKGAADPLVRAALRDARTATVLAASERLSAELRAIGHGIVQQIQHDKLTFGC